MVYINPIQRLHLNTLISILNTLSLLPASYLFHYLWSYSTNADQLMIRFFALSLFIAWVIIAFINAIFQTIAKLDQYLDQNQLMLFTIYKQIPIIFFSIFLIFLQLKFC